jgi:hypothetical protein
MKVAQVRNCMFQKWFPLFKNVTLKSIIIPLSEEFVKYLNEDDIFTDETVFPTPENEDRYDEGEEAWPEENLQDHEVLINHFATHAL